MIVICYDGSEAAEAAADEGIRLFREDRATVLTVWDPYSPKLLVSGSGLGSGFGLGHDRIDQARLLEQAERTAEEGAQRLRAAGMGADSLVEERAGSIAKTVLEVAARVKADAVIVGTRGRGEARSALLGSVSHDLVQHADRPLVVVPSAVLARPRQG